MLLLLFLLSIVIVTTVAMSLIDAIVAVTYVFVIIPCRVYSRVCMGVGVSKHSIRLPNFGDDGSIT